MRNQALERRMPIHSPPGPPLGLRVLELTKPDFPSVARNLGRKVVDCFICDVFVEFLKHML